MSRIDGNHWTQKDLESSQGALLLEFGASGCPHCQALAPKLEALLSDYPSITHVKVEDGRGLPLGRAFKVKLWPNLVFLYDGKVRDQLARPSIEAVRSVLARLGEKISTD